MQNKIINMLKKYKSNKIYYQSTITLAGPVVISQFGHTLVQTVDTIIIGHYAGTISLAAVSLVHSVFIVVLVIGLGVAYGLTPLIAQENGKSNFKECARLLSNSLWLNVLTSVLLFLVVYFGSMYAMQHSHQDPQVVETAKPYLLILSLSIVPLMIFQTFKQFAEGLGFTKQAMNISIWGNVLNVVVAVILVKGFFGIEPMGVRGVGIAALIDRVLMMLIMVWYVLRSDRFKIYLQYFSIKFLDFSKIQAVVKIGIPVAMQYAFEIGAFAVGAVIAGQLGSNEQAAHQVAITFAAMTYMMAGGIGSAATIKVGNSLGKQNYVRLKKFAEACYHLVIIFMFFFAVVFTLFNQYLPYLITSDAKVIVLASQLLIIAGIFQFFDGTQVVGLGTLRGMGDVNVPTFITFVAYWLIGLPSCYVFGIHFNIGLRGIWYGLTLGLLTSSVLLYLRFRYVMNRKLREKELSFKIIP